LDISDLNNVKRLDDPNETQPIIGPHYVKISPDKKVSFTGFWPLPGPLDHLTNIVAEPVGDGLLRAGR
jgi:selenium-binding protein 1